MEHVAVVPTSENGWASWHCTSCDQDCASDNPCDHCMDETWEWFAEQREQD